MTNQQITQQRLKKDAQRVTERPKRRSLRNSLREGIVVAATVMLSAGCACNLKDSQTAKSESAGTRRLEQKVEALEQEVKALEIKARDCEADRTKASPLAEEGMLESQLILAPDMDLKKLKARVIIFRRAGKKHTSVKDAMEEIMESCRDSGNMRECIKNRALEATAVHITQLENPALGFEYYDTGKGDFVSLDQMGLVKGNECDISNLAPGVIRVTFFPKADQRIMASQASIQLER